jgi:hypothetical protein
MLSKVNPLRIPLVISLLSILILLSQLILDRPRWLFSSSFLLQFCMHLLFLLSMAHAFDFTSIIFVCSLSLSALGGTRGYSNALRFIGRPRIIYGRLEGTCCGNILTQFSILKRANSPDPTSQLVYVLTFLILTSFFNCFSFWTQISCCLSENRTKIRLALESEE